MIHYYLLENKNKLSNFISTVTVCNTIKFVEKVERELKFGYLIFGDLHLSKFLGFVSTYIDN